MFAPKVPKPQAKDQHRSHNKSTTGGMLPRSISDTYWRPLSPERSLWPSGNTASDQVDETPAIKTASTAAWNFCQVPVYPPGGMGGLVPPPAAPRLSIQAKLKVGAVNDPLEQEADRVAEQVMRLPAPEVAVTSAPPQVSRKCDTCEEEEKLQTKPAGPQAAAGKAPAIVHEVLRSPGQPLDAATRAYFEPRFGHDFSQVRVHTDAAAEQSARDVNAHAYTVGHNMVFDAGRFAPGTHEGRGLLAHELSHVVQQHAAGGTHAEQSNATRGPISLAESQASDLYEAEADAAANRHVQVCACEVVIRDDGDAVRSGHKVPSIQRKEVDKQQKEKKVRDFTVESDHGIRGSYFIYFSKPFTREEVLGILFTGATLPQGFRLEDEGLTLRGGWTWKLRTGSRVIEPSIFSDHFSPALKKHFNAETLKLTPEESASIRAKSEAFMDSRPVYLGGQSVREAFEKCRDHKVGDGCWGKRAGFFYYVGWQSGYDRRVLEVKSAPELEIINRDWEWWLNDGKTLNDAARAEEELQTEILKQVILGYANAFAAAPGAGAPGLLRRPSPVPLSAVRQVGKIVPTGIQAYVEWKVASGKNIEKSDLLLMGLAGIVGGGAEFFEPPASARATQLPPGPTRRPTPSAPAAGDVKPAAPSTAISVPAPDPRLPTKVPVNENAINDIARARQKINAAKTRPQQQTHVQAAELAPTGTGDVAPAKVIDVGGAQSVPTSSQDPTRMGPKPKPGTPAASSVREAFRRTGVSESVEELGRSAGGTNTREAATVGTEIEPIEVQDWAAELNGEGFQTYTRHQFGRGEIGGRRLSSMFTDARSRPDMIAVSEADRTAIVGDVTGNPGSTAGIPGRIGQEEGLHIEKTIEYARQLKRHLGAAYRVFAQDKHWQTGTETKRIEVF